ncbi:MAG: hypothetical protein HOV80_30105 [Polyangiaceae bacterium]|nr:hypothetical protein [Polyangiaceae bacterium]
MSVRFVSTLIAAAIVTGCSSVTPSRSSTATPSSMAEGSAVVDDLTVKWEIVGSAGHAGALEARTGDSIWRIRFGGLELCRGEPRACKPVATDGVPPDTLVVPQIEPGRRSETPSNAVWLRGLPAAAIRGGKGALAYCSAEGDEPRCAAAKFPVQHDVVRGVLATKRIRMPKPKDAIWVALSKRVARCVASPETLDPRCEVVDVPEVDL